MIQPRRSPSKFALFDFILSLFARGEVEDEIPDAARRLRAGEIRGAGDIHLRAAGDTHLRAGETRGAEIRGAELRGRLRSRLRRRLQRRLRSVQKSARVAARALAATAESLSRMECAGLGAAMLAIVALPRLTRLGRIVKIVVN